MTSAYRKRAKGGWNNDKEVSNRKERNYEARLEKEAEQADSAFVEDVMIRSECNEELNAMLSGYEDPIEPTRPNTKKKNEHKDVTRFLSRIRRIYKLCKGDIEYLNKPRDGRNDWIRDYYQGYYQEYKKGLPKLIELSKRDDIPAKIIRQAKELMVLFNIETT